MSRYRFLPADGIILVWHEDAGAGPTRSRVRLTGALCKHNDGDGKTVGAPLVYRAQLITLD